MAKPPPAPPPTAGRYATDPGRIGHARSGLPVALAAMTPAAAADLGTRLAAIDPWARVAFTAPQFSAYLAAVEAGVSRYAIAAAGETAGAMVVRHRWLHGPYLHILGLLPRWQGQGVGDAALAWYEAEARGVHRNLWLCCSAFNTEARRFYEAHGFAVAGVLDRLIDDGEDELLMRKRLT